MELRLEGTSGDQLTQNTHPFLPLLKARGIFCWVLNIFKDSTIFLCNLFRFLTTLTEIKGPFVY